MNKKVWHEGGGDYCASVGATETISTPITLVATLEPMQEIILQTKDMKQIERFKKYFVHGVTRSGLILAEESDTGENDLTQVDGDNDALPQFQYAKNGQKGVAAVYASKVMIKTPEEGEHIARSRL